MSAQGLPDASQGCIPALPLTAWMWRFLWNVLCRLSFNAPLLTQKHLCQQRLSHHHSELPSEGTPFMTDLPMCHNHRKLRKGKIRFKKKKKKTGDCGSQLLKRLILGSHQPVTSGAHSWHHCTSCLAFWANITPLPELGGGGASDYFSKFDRSQCVLTRTVINRGPLL